MVGFFIVIELSKLLSDLLNFWVVIILLNLTIFVVLISSHAHASVDLHGSNSFSRQVASDVGLNFDQQSHLFSGHSPIEVRGVVSSYVS